MDLDGLGLFKLEGGLHMDWTTLDWILVGRRRKWIWTLIQFQIYLRLERKPRRDILGSILVGYSSTP
jgi:hypothetical protein